jgi:hypothetical protein
LARTELTPIDSSQSGTTVTYSAVDATNGNYFVNNGAEYIIVKNGSAAAITTTVLSVPCSHGRTADSVVSVPAGGEKIVGPFPRDLFNQPNSRDIHVDFSDGTSVTAAVIKP